MGLDMYLTKRVYIGANYEHRNITGEVNIRQGNDNKPIIVNFNKVTEIIEEAAYWRKANQIHKWFVDNCSNGVDNCEEVYVSTEQLKTLLDTCKKVNENHELASELLPTQSGFFFGGTDYDEGYYHDIEYTINILETILKDNSGDFYYRASW